MNCTNYVDFVKNFRIFKEASKEEPECFFKDVGNHEKFFKDIEENINSCKIFEVENEETINKLLLLTNNPDENKELNLPFDSMFFDVHFTKEYLKSFNINIHSEEIIGILIRKGEFLEKTSDKVLFKNLRITICHKGNYDDSEKKYILFSTISRGLSKKDEKIIQEGYGFKFDEQAEKIFSEDMDTIFKFIINYLNFTNNPEVELIEHKRSEKNIMRKIREGKVIIPSTVKIILKGHLKKYIDSVSRNEETQWHYNYSFWVKGHFRNLVSPRYITNKRIWIFPFIKGKGNLITKTYSLKLKEEMIAQ